MEYKRYKCEICGFIYDEKVGFPDEGFPPGTKWLEIPEDWFCPDCGVGKKDFTIVI